MNKNISEDSENVLFKKLHILTKLIEQLRDSGIKENIKLPKICVLGGQSSGKSSVLESIIGLDILPRGDGIVTRRPLELNLHHINSGEPWATFEERKGIKFTDFIKVRETIENLTDELCRKMNNISEKPIILNVYSQACPDLSLVDLPGVKRIPIGYCHKNIEEITQNIAKRYIDDPLTIILCTIPANTDIATSESLRLAKEIDISGERTIGVLTKLDFMDEGTDARNILLNEYIPLKLGYVAIKNRSITDRINKLTIAETIIKEKEFFKVHPAYNNLPSELLGIDALINKITKLYFRMVRKNCPIIVHAIKERIKTVEKELAELSDIMSEIQFDNSDEDNTCGQINKKIDEAKKSKEKKEEKFPNQENPKDPSSKSKDNIKKGYGNLFG